MQLSFPLDSTINHDLNLNLNPGKEKKENDDLKKLINSINDLSKHTSPPNTYNDSNNILIESLNSLKYEQEIINSLKSSNIQRVSRMSVTSSGFYSSMSSVSSSTSASPITTVDYGLAENNRIETSSLTTNSTKEINKKKLTRCRVLNNILFPELVLASKK